MKKIWLGLGGVVFAGVLLSQVPGTAIQQTPQMLQSANIVAHSHTTATTLTLTAGGSNYIYITGMDISDCATGTAVTAAAPTYITTTGLSGAPQYQVGSGVTAGLCTSTPLGFGSQALKSQTAGTNVTFVLPTFATNQVVSVNVYYYVAPGP